MSLRIALIAGEASGDQLGAELMQRIRERNPDVTFEAVSGPRMREVGCRSIGDIEDLSLMGITEVLRHVPRLLKLRRELVNYLLEDRPDVVIGIDNPDFNLGLERRLRAAGIPTAHYVSPTIWAWRPKRIHAVARAADRVFCLYPFEPELYAAVNVPADFVGHPLAREIHRPMSRQSARQVLGLSEQETVVALLPGSRISEIRRLGSLFLQTAAALRERMPRLRFVIPAAGTNCESAIAALPELSHMELPVELLSRGGARTAIAASNAVLCASGTVTLEAMLLERPAVVAYRISPVSHALLRGLGLIESRYFAMPNILAKEMLMPEFMQGEARPEPMAEALQEVLSDRHRRQQLREKYRGLAAGLRHGDPGVAAREVLCLAEANQ